LKKFFVFFLGAFWLINTLAWGGESQDGNNTSASVDQPTPFHGIVLGLDGGEGFYTGGLGATNSTAISGGIKALYFFDTHVAVELAAHFGNSLDSVHPNGVTYADIGTVLTPVTAGARYYFDLPEPISIAHPYLALGVGAYFRNQTILDEQNIDLQNYSGIQPGAYIGGGIQFPVYRDMLTVGFDVRFHYILFADAGDTFGGFLPIGSRAGNYVTSGLEIDCTL
jgi:hypothetical protein